MQAQTWRILHIDDDEDDQYLVRSMLKEAKGQTVTLDWAATFDEGRQKLSENEYEAVLVDYDLGARTGIELIRAFVNQGYAAPFILLTGRGTYEVDVEAMRAGATLYLTKNEINPLLLERSVRYAIERKQVESALRERDRKLSVALEAAQLGAWTYFFDDHMFEMDERAQEMYNASSARENHDEIVKRFLHPDDVQPMLDALQRAQDPAGDGSYRMEYRIKRPDGSICWLSAWGQAEFDGHGAERHAARLTGASREITWEKKAKLALEESNAALRESERSVKELAGRFQAVIENSLDVAYRRNLITDRYDYMSPVVEQVLGYTVAEMLNMPVQETLSHIHPEDRQRIENELERTIELGKGKLEYRFMCKDGQYHWLADHVTVTRDADGTVFYRTGIVRDVTEQRRSDLALRASEERFQLASRAVNGVLYDISLSRDEIYQSEGLERVVGYRPGEEPGGSRDWWPRNIHPDDYPRVQTSLRAAIESREDSIAYEYRIRHKDGHWVHVWDQGYIVRDDSGNAQRIVGLCSDITDRVQAERALSDSERVRQETDDRFRDLANNISQLAWMTDPMGQVIWYNQRWFDYTGTTPEEMMREGWRKFHHPDHVDRVMEKINHCFAIGENWEDTYPLRGKDGSYRWFLSQAKPIKDEQGRVVRWFGTNTDITDQQLLQEENRRQKDLLGRLVQTAPVGIAFLTGPEHIYNLFNTEYRHYARSKDLLIGRSVAEVWPEIAEIVIPQLDRVYQTGETFSVANAPLTIDRDGKPEEGFYTYTYTPIYNLDGRIEGVMVLVIETTSTIQAKLSAEAQTLRLQAVLNALPVGVWVSDEKGRLVGKNEQADRIWAGSAPLVENIDQYQQYPAWFANSAQRVRPDEYPLARVLMTGQPVEPVELDIRRFDNSEGTVLVYAAPIQDKEGRLAGAVVINVDITDRKQAEVALLENSASLHKSEVQYRELAEALKIERAKLAAAIDQLPLGVGIMDIQGNILSLNNAGLRLHWFASEAEMLSGLERYIEAFELRSLDGRVMPVEDWPASKALRGEFVQNQELQLLNLVNNTDHVVSYSAAPVYNGDGKLILIVYMIQDLTERALNEEALRESETRYRLAARATNDAIWDWNLTTDLIEWNESLSELFGYPPSDQCDSSGDWWKAHIHPDDRAWVIEKIHAIIDSAEEVWKASYRFLRADGSYAEIYDRGWVVRDEDGRPVRMVGAMRDVTARNEVERALRQSEERFRQLADAMPQLVWTARSDGAVDYYNQRYQDYGGIAPSAGGIWNWGPVLHSDDLQPTVQAWEDAVRTGTTYQIEHRVRMMDGSYRWHLSRGVPTYDDHGNLVRWFGTATDIHDFKQAQELLRQREQRLRSLFNANLIGIVTRDRAGKILEANNAYLQMVGYTSEEVEAGKCNAREITPPEYHHLEQYWTEEVMTNGYCKPFEKEYIRRDGKRIPVLVGYSVSDAEKTEFIGFVLDLSELKQAQAELAEYAEKLKRSNEELENFAFVASHDLQEPLRKINLFGSSLRRQLDGQLTEKAEEYLDRMQNATDRMQAMINGLLELSRVNMRGSTFKQVDLNEVVEEVVSDLEPRINASGGQVIVDPLPVVDGDALQLRLLLQNLLGNALKFHKEDVAPVVRVTGTMIQSEKTPLAKIVIEDNGIGFDEEYADQIFQPFVRLQGRSQYEGSGIGLAICRKIVERHAGSITASSQAGEGSKFVITLPVNNPQAEKEER